MAIGGGPSKGSPFLQDIPILTQQPDIQTLFPTTIAILGGNTVAGLALSFLLRDAGYATIILKAPPTGPADDLLRDVDLLLVSPDLDDE